MKRQKKSPPASFPIHLLQNAFMYLLDTVILLNVDTDTYRLLVVKNKSILVDENPGSRQHCEKRFRELFDCQRCKKNVVPAWSPKYRPDRDWLDMLLGYKKCLITD